MSNRIDMTVVLITIQICKSIDVDNMHVNEGSIILWK